MIELGQFFLNSATMSETITSEVGEDKKEELALDADSFIVLMTQMLPDVAPILPSKITLGASVQGEELTQSQGDPIDSIDEGEANQNALERLDKHGALAWINSENYQPPKQAEQINPESFEVLTNQSTIENYLPSKSGLNESFTQSTLQVQSSDALPASETLNSSSSSFFDASLEEDGIFISHQSEDKAVIANTPVDTTKIQLQPSGLEDSAINTEMLTPAQPGESFEVKYAPLQPLTDKNEVDVPVKFMDSQDKPQDSVEPMKVQQQPLFEVKQENRSFESAQQEPHETKFEHLTELNMTTKPQDKRLNSINPYKEINFASKVDPAQTPMKIEMDSQIANQLVETSQPVISPTAIINSTQPNWSVTTPKALEIPAALGSPEWADQFSEQVVWVGQSGSQSAVIKIHPEDLGPLEISVKVVDDLASVTITSHSSHVREMVDQALPRLREMMAENGLNLSNTSIGSDGKSRQSQQQQGNSEQGTTGYAADEKLLPSATKKASKGLVDYFA